MSFLIAGPAYRSFVEAEKALIECACHAFQMASVAGSRFSFRLRGFAEAHGRAEMMEFNYLVEKGAVDRDPGTGRYAINIERMPATIVSLAKELLQMEATGDRGRVETWFTKYGRMPDDLAKSLAASSDIPVDVDPVFSFPETVR